MQREGENAMEPQVPPNEIKPTPDQPEKKPLRYALWIRITAIILVISLLLSVTAVDFSLLRYRGTDQMIAAEYLMASTAYIGQDRLQRLKTLLTGVDSFTINLNAAEIAIGKMDYSRAATFLNKAISACTDTIQMAELYSRLGCVYMLEKAPDKALEAFDCSIQMDPTVPAAYVLRSQLRYQSGDQTGAIQDAAEYLNLGGEDPEMLTTAMSILELGGKLELAVEAATRKLANVHEDIKRADVYAELGRLKYLQGRDKDAYEDIARAKTLDRTVLTGVHYAILGLYEYNQEDYTNSRSNFLQAARLSDDSNAEYYEQAIMCGYLSQDYDFIKQTIDEAKKKNNMTASSYLIDGIMMFSEERYQEAVDSLTASVNTGKVVTGAYYYRGLSYLAIGDFQKAAEDFTQATYWEEDIYSCIFNRGVCYYALEQDDRAREDFQNVVENCADEALAQSAAELLAEMKE